MPPKVTFVYTLRNSFVDRDLNLLSDKGYVVREIVSPPDKNPIKFLIHRIRELMRSLWLVPQSKLLVVWFSDYHGYFPLLIAKWFRKKSLLILGGYDVVADPANHYGIFSKKNLRSVLALQNLNNATHLWAVDETLIKGCPQAFKSNKIQSGLVHFAPKQLPKATVVPTGYDAAYWKRDFEKTPQTVLTVGLFTDLRVAQRKGIPLFLKLAALCPEFQFTILGEQNQSIVSHYTIPQNVYVLPKASPETLLEAYGKHQFYFQGSRVEGLPNVLCEAMLCECIPIGAAAFGIPNAIGASGHIFNEEKDLIEVAAFLKNADPKLGSLARQRIIDKFSISKRQNAFATHLN